MTDRNWILPNYQHSVHFPGFERDCTTQKDTATRLVSLTATDGSTVVNEHDGEKTVYFRAPTALASTTCYQVLTAILGSQFRSKSFLYILYT